MKSLQEQLSILQIIIVGIFLIGCSGNPSAGTSESSARAQVQITHVRQGTISDSVALTAVTTFLKKNVVSAPITGYITKSNVQPGMKVDEGRSLFTVQTREAITLKGALPDTLLPQRRGQFGSVTLSAGTDGSVVDVNHYQGDYVSEGDRLCTIVHLEDLAFKLYVPYRFHGVLHPGKKITIQLPDQHRMQAVVIQQLSMADSSSQSAVYLLKPESPIILPDGLRVVATVITNQHRNTQLLPKEAVLANETMDQFWIMKVVHDSLALKVTVTEGITNPQMVEILKPKLSPEDKIIISGNYGLEDSTKVRIQQ